MLRGVIVLALIASSLCATIVDSIGEPAERIIGGQDASIEDYPYQVEVRYLNAHICGGAILSDRVIVTSAQCLRYSYPSYYSISYGSNWLGESRNAIPAYQIVRHPGYSSYTHDYDVAIIRLMYPIAFGANARAITIATVPPAPDTAAVVSGWGITSEYYPYNSRTLQAVQVNVIEQGVCNREYRTQMSDRMLCAGVENGGKNACQGDAGGPLVANNELIGIVSWGVGCGRPNYPAVYTNVAKVSGWLLSFV